MPVNIYARIRPMLPFEAGQKNIIECKGPDLTLCPPPGAKFEKRTFTFTAISERESSNEDCFDLVAKPMADTVLEGYNAVLLAYGQTGCGKTFTMLGKPKMNVVGLVPKCMDYLLQHESSPKLELSVVEAYSRNVMKIELFDLLKPSNQTGEDWDSKKGSTTLQVKQLIHKEITSGEQGRQLIIGAQKAGHYAPTGKNPESSRGHCMFCMKVSPVNVGTTIVDPSTFVFVDLAGSEGETALTPEFCAAHTQETVLMRRMEGGVINNGLSAIQSIFRELSKHGKVAKVGKTGVRRILLDYINRDTAMAVMFMLSPAEFNVGPTTSTLYFAKAAALVKVKPKKKVARVNWEAVAAMQKEEIATLTIQRDGLLAELMKLKPDYTPNFECDMNEVNENAQKASTSLRATFKHAATPKATPVPQKAAKKDTVVASTAAKPATTVDVEAIEAPTPDHTRKDALAKLYADIDGDMDQDKNDENQLGSLMFHEQHERTPEEIMEIDDLEELTPPELLTRAQGLEFLLESERSLRQENEKNKDLFIEYLTEGMNNLRKKMRKLAKAHELLKKKHGDKR